MGQGDNTNVCMSCGDDSGPTWSGRCRFCKDKHDAELESLVKLSISSRPDWDEIWMSFAEQLARRSSDVRLKVGAVVVPDDNTAVLAIGYNGDERGGSNEPESHEPGQTGFLHAEINALIKLDFSLHKQKVMYLTHSPCRMCCKAIVNAGIKRVVFKEHYRDTSGLKILTNAGIVVRCFQAHTY